MKKTVFGAVLMALSMQGYAFEDDALQHSKRGEFYFGFNATRIDASGFKDAARAVGAGVGVNLVNKSYGTIALDTFFARTIDAALDRNNVEADVNLAGGFFAYRSPQKIYGKARMGMVLTELEIDSGDDSDNSEFAWGAGVGAEVYYGVDLELEYTKVDEVDAISVSLIFGD